MVQLSISAASSHVRRMLDELVSVEEIGMIASPDGIDLHRLVEGAIIEAAVKVHSQALSIYIDGVKGVKDTDYTLELKDGVVKIVMLTDVVRIASVKASDSAMVLCDLIPEDSAEGRKQLNKHVRGIPDDPRVVLQKVWANEYCPILKYYTYEGVEEELDIELNIVPYPKIEETIVEICPRLEYAVLNEIMAIVLDSLGEHEKADVYRAKNKEYSEGR